MNVSYEIDHSRSALVRVCIGGSHNLHAMTQYHFRCERRVDLYLTHSNFHLRRTWRIRKCVSQFLVSIHLSHIA